MLYVKTRQGQLLQCLPLAQTVDDYAALLPGAWPPHCGKPIASRNNPEERHNWPHTYIPSRSTQFQTVTLSIQNRTPGQEKKKCNLRL